MVTVTVHKEGEAPAAKLLATSAKSVDVADALGRKITLRKPKPLDKLDFAEAAGGAEINQLYLAEVMHLQFVGAIDGETVPIPSTKGELRARYARLGDEGNDAVQTGVLANFLSISEKRDEELKNF